MENQIDMISQITQLEFGPKQVLGKENPHDGTFLDYLPKIASLLLSGLLYLVFLFDYAPPMYWSSQLESL
jgi:hypothetical protein